MGNCLPTIFGGESRTSRSHSATALSRTRRQGDGTQMSFSNPIMETMSEHSSAYVNQLYAANIARQSSANTEGKELEEARKNRVKRLLEQIPADIFRSDMKATECAICMVDFEVGEYVRYLPCMHFFHQECVDDWLLTRSFTCPTCMEPVDSTILSSLTAHTQQSLHDLACSPATQSK
ncbi:unnamed protein product [Auanema sp. JU1783]|nr:unnamed protein product [Auanema sp. JU1783]